MAAWAPIYASSQRMLGDAIFTHLYPQWRERKAGQIAASFARHPEWIVVACAAPAKADTGADPPGLANKQPHDGGAETIAGFVTYRLDMDARVGEIGNNAVDPAWQGRGIAGALYGDVLARFRAAGMRVARVSTGLDDAHAPARAA